MTTTFCYRVELWREEAPDYFEWVRIGERKTKRGAQGLAEKQIGRIYGYQQQKDGSLIAETAKGKARIREGWFQET